MLYLGIIKEDINPCKGVKQMLVPMTVTDGLAPYQIRSNREELWLENMETHAESFRGKDTIALKKMLTQQRNKMNSRVGLDRCGV